MSIGSIAQSSNETETESQRQSKALADAVKREFTEIIKIDTEELKESLENKLLQNTEKKRWLYSLDRRILKITLMFIQQRKTAKICIYRFMLNNLFITFILKMPLNRIAAHERVIWVFKSFLKKNGK